MRGLQTGILLCDDCGCGSDDVRFVKKHERDLCNRCQIQRLNQETDALRAALRERCLKRVVTTIYCHECGSRWDMSQDEEHKLSCLAKLPQKT